MTCILIGNGLKVMGERMWEVESGNGSRIRKTDKTSALQNYLYTLKDLHFFISSKPQHLFILMGLKYYPIMT